MSVDQFPDPFEEQLSVALRDAGGSFDTDRAALAAAGQARGRRLRLRRRAAVAGGAAGLALVGVGGALLVPSGSTHGPAESSVAAKGTATPAAGGFSAREVVRTLERLLPGGTFSGQEGRGTADEAGPLAYVVYDDGKGPAAVSVALSRIPTGRGFDPAREVQPCPETGEGAPSGLDSCETGKLPNGSAITVYKGYEYPDRRADTKAWGAELITPTGQRVNVSEWNSPAEKGKPVSRPEPPLDTAGLKRLAAAKEWRRIIDALPELSPAPTASPSAGQSVGLQRILGVLTARLPKDVQVVSRGGQETEYGYVVVDDGKGRGYVEINVQPNMLDAADALYQGAETLPDGTRVRTRQQPDEKGREGVVMWTVDTMRKDGRRVVVSAYNAAGLKTGATRPEPVLSMRELRDIALAPHWESLGS
ncbi:hypothetical protein ACIRG4_20705 [Streptomyces sp. NPDC102395]|uniref:hypothetical protein n=1 Tax=Streptomyces sp. NPDC102395 TaxID=3366168 RepID=UPI003801D735